MTSSDTLSNLELNHDDTLPFRPKRKIKKTTKMRDLIEAMKGQRGVKKEPLPVNMKHQGIKRQHP